MKPAAILAISASEPEQLFDPPKDQDELHRQYVRLLKTWHPDKNKDPLATEVFAHLTQLYEAARKMVAAGIWRSTDNSVEFTGRDGKKRRLKFRKKKTFELGEVLIGTRLVTYVVDRKHDDLVLSGVRFTGRLRFPSENFKRMERFFPKVEKMFETEDKTVICVAKDRDDVALDDLLSHLGGKMDPKHAAWVVSRLLNLVCFTSLVNGTVLNGIEPSSLWVNPPAHRVSIFGGWWYGLESKKQVKFLPPFVHARASRSFLEKKEADVQLDLDCCKAVGRTCLGDVSGGSFRTRPDIPKPMAEFLLAPSGRKALTEYENWQRVLEDSWGPRRFHRLSVTGDDVYPTKGARHG